GPGRDEGAVGIQEGPGPAAEGADDHDVVRLVVADVFDHDNGQPVAKLGPVQGDAPHAGVTDGEDPVSTADEDDIVADGGRGADDVNGPKVGGPGDGLQVAGDVDPPPPAVERGEGAAVEVDGEDPAPV